MKHLAVGRPWVRGIAWSLAVWLAVGIAALVDQVVGDGEPDWLWAGVALAAVFLIGTRIGQPWWIGGCQWVLAPLAAFLVWQMSAVLAKDPRQSPDIGVEIMIVVYGTPIVLGLGALLLRGAAWLGVAIGGRT